MQSPISKYKVGDILTLDPLATHPVDLLHWVGSYFIVTRVFHHGAWINIMDLKTAETLNYITAKEAEQFESVQLTPLEKAIYLGIIKE